MRAAIFDAGIGQLEEESGIASGHVGGELTLRALSWVLGFLLPMRRFKERIASLGCTVFDRMESEISRLRAMSSRLDEVARSTCSSRAELDVNQPAIILNHSRPSARCE